MSKQRLSKGRQAGRWVPVALLAFLVVGTAVTADAQRPGRGRGNAAGTADQASEAPTVPAVRGDGFCERLDLSDEQREAIEKLRGEGREQGIEMHKDLLRARHALKGTLLEDEPSLSTVRDLARKIGEIETQRQIARLEQRLAIRKILTPEQRDRLLLMEQRRGHQRGGPGRGRPGVRGGRQMGRAPGQFGRGAPGAPCAPGAPMAPGSGHGPHGMGRGGFHGEWFAPDPDDASSAETYEFGLLWPDAPLDE